MNSTTDPYMDAITHDVYYYYDKKTDNVTECSWDEYNKLISKSDNKKQHVKHDEFILNGKKYKISTICLYVDHNYPKNRISPLIFETMIFSDDHQYDMYIKRYTTVREAKENHDQMILSVIRGEDK